MAILDRLRGEEQGPDIAQRLEKGRARHRTWLTTWGEQVAFYEGRQFVWRNTRGTLNETRIETDAKEWYRSRTVRNRIFKVVNAEVSAGTQRVPEYEVQPTSNDAEDIDAAKLSEKALLYLYELLEIRRKMALAFRSAIITGEGFLRPYWNPEVGAPIQMPEGQDNPETPLYEGQVALEFLGPEAVYWEPGVSFDDSSWHAVERAMTPEQVKEIPNYNGSSLKADSVSRSTFVQSQLSKDSAQADTVLVTEYLEKPKKGNQGKRQYFAAGSHLTASESYPVQIEGPQGYEPCLLKLSYVETPHRDRDMGLVEHLLDAQRAYNAVINKQIEWITVALNPQAITGPGGMIDPLTSEPGAVFRVKGDPRELQWREVPTVPPALDEFGQRAIEDMEEISSQRSIPSQVESGKAIVAMLDQDDSVRANVIQNLADFHSKLGRQLLWLAQSYYSEERLIRINGRMGSEHLSFRGVDLRNQIDVLVLPGSIEPRTKQAVQQKVLDYADRQWISPEQAMAAIDGGSAESIAESYQYDISRANRIIQKIKAGPEFLFSAPLVQSAEPCPACQGAGVLPSADQTEAPCPECQGSGKQMVPDWMPRAFDKIPVHKTQFEDWMKTTDYDNSTPDVRQAANLYYAALLDIESKQAQREAELQSMMAEQQGMQNAAKPQGAKPMPSMPSTNGEDPYAQR